MKEKIDTVTEYADYPSHILSSDALHECCTESVCLTLA